MNKHTDENMEKARLAFKKLIIDTPQDGDKFFENKEYWKGNTIGEIIDKPFERFNEYERLLIIIKNEDENKYEKIHKGTPFFFLAWMAFDLKNYEKAVFYIDAAISEDMRNKPDNWSRYAAGQFLFLNHNGNEPWERIVKLKKKFLDELQRFNNVSGLPEIHKIDFINKFVKILLQAKENHSIITAFYSYILEFEEREKELLLRSSQGGSIEPVLTYLFKGSLIFESLLKYLYKKSDDQNYLQLRDIFETPEFKGDFVHIKKSSANSLQEIVGAIKTNDLRTAFKTTSKLRNTSGHNLVWVDIFDNPANFKKLYEQQVNAILYLIQKKFIV